MQLSHPIRALAAAVLAATVAIVPLAPAASSAAAAGDAPDPADKPLTTVASLADPDVDRREIPEDRYAMALGCYDLTNAATGQPLGRDGAGYATAAAPFHFEPTALGTYLLLDTEGDVLAAAKGPAERAEDAIDAAERVSPVDRTTDVPGSLEGLAPDPIDGDPYDHAPTVDTHTGEIVPGTAGPSADWRARRNLDGTFTFTLDAASGRALAVVDGTPRLADAATADGSTAFDLRATDEAECAEWPEVEVNVDGPVLAGATPWDETRGTIDAHLHLMAYEFLGGEFRCGRPWHRYGVEVALGDCAENEFAGGRLAEAGFGDGPGNFGDDEFWPNFTVPTPSSKTYEQVYHRWLERAWRGGLRMMTVLMVENNVLCELWPDKRNSCNEMESVRLQIQRLNELVDYLDARAGGPGEGWAQIATDPFEARRIVNEGKLAFVMGIEVSALFECHEMLGVSTCTNADISRQLDEMQELGIVQMELVNKFDNALSGVKGDGGTTGTVVNQGNFKDTGHYWKMDTCPEERDFGNDRHQANLPDESEGTPFEPVARDPLAGQVLSATGTSGATVVYPEGPHCNTIGLTPQGVFTLQEMASRGMLFDPDHMSALGAKQALDVMEDLGYTGIVSSHGWADDLIYERIYELGGTVTQYAGGSSGFLNNYRKSLDWIDDRYYFGFGYGADTNGLGGQGGPRNPDEANDVDYPFVAPGGALVHQQVSGDRAPYDINTDGVAHYGLYPDWIEDLRVQGGDEVIEDMLRGPEAYLQVWERAVGVPKDACIFASEIDRTDAVRRGMTFDEVLLTAGQPHVRDADAYTFCGTADDGEATHVTVEFDDAGRVAKVKEKMAKDPLPAINPDRSRTAALSVEAVRDDVTVDHRNHDHDHGATDTDTHDEVHAASVEAPESAPTLAAASGSRGFTDGDLSIIALALGALGFVTRRMRSEGSV